MVTVELNESVNGSVLCTLVPVSPATPFSVIAVVLPDGGVTVMALTVTFVGSVIVLSPLAKVMSLISPGLSVLEAAEIYWVPRTSPVKVMVVVLEDVIANVYPQKSPVIVWGSSVRSASMRRIRSTATLVSPGR